MFTKLVVHWVKTKMGMQAIRWSYNPLFNNVMASLLLPSFKWCCNPQQIPPAVQTSWSIRTLSIFFKHFLDELCAPKLKGSVLVFTIAVSKLVTQILRVHFDSKTCFFYLNRQTSTKCREKITSMHVFKLNIL